MLHFSLLENDCYIDVDASVQEDKDKIKNDIQLFDKKLSILNMVNNNDITKCIMEKFVMFKLMI